MNFNPKDHFFRKAKSENYAARSVYKLEEIQKKHRILKAKDAVLDLGASPGSWSQYASKIIGAGGLLVGIDLKPIEVKLPNAEFIVGDVLQYEWKNFLSDRNLTAFDVVISDMAPSTTGIKFTDQARSTELCEMALTLADQFLKTGGHFVCKLFHSDDFREIKTRMQTSYRAFEALKPQSTRSQSKEIFLIGIGKK